MLNNSIRPSDYKQIIDLNIQFVTDLVNHINPDYEVHFPTGMYTRRLTPFNSQVYERGQLKATLNSSVRFTPSSRYSSALIDVDIAESLLNISQISPVFAAWWYSDSKVFLYRLDELAGLNSNARILSKLTPTSYFVNPKK